MIWFTSDTHLSHNKDFIFKARGFDSIQEHDETLMRNWNEKVSNDDEVYHLGDVAFGNPIKAKYIIEQLNGKKYLVRGNHEKTVLNREHVRNLFEWIKDYHELKIPDETAPNKYRLICLFHYPIVSWRGKTAAKGFHLHGNGTLKKILQSVYGNDYPEDSFHLHGHSHGKYKSEENRILDVGVDNCNFYPISIDEVFEYMKNIS